MAVIRHQKTESRGVSSTLLASVVMTASSSSMTFDSESSSYGVEEVYGRGSRSAPVQNLATPLAQQIAGKSSSVQVLEQLAKVREGVKATQEMHEKIGELKSLICLEKAAPQVAPQVAPISAAVQSPAVHENFQGYFTHVVPQAPAPAPVVAAGEGAQVMYTLVPAQQAALPTPAVAEPVAVSPAPAAQVYTLVPAGEVVAPAPAVSAPVVPAPAVAAPAEVIYVMAPAGAVAAPVEIAAPPAVEVVYQFAPLPAPEPVVVAPTPAVAVPAPAAVPQYVLTPAVQPTVVAPVQAEAAPQQVMYTLAPAVETPARNVMYTKPTLGRGSTLCGIATELKKLSGEMLQGEQRLFEKELQKALQDTGVRAAARAHQLNKNGGYPVLNDGVKDAEALVGLMESRDLHDSTKRQALERAARLNAGLEAMLGSVEGTPQAAQELQADWEAYSDFASSNSSSAFI